MYQEFCFFPERNVDRCNLHEQSFVSWLFLSTAYIHHMHTCSSFNQYTHTYLHTHPFTTAVRYPSPVTAAGVSGGKVPESAKELLRWLLSDKPGKRPVASQLVNYPWLCTPAQYGTHTQSHGRTASSSQFTPIDMHRFWMFQSAVWISCRQLVATPQGVSAV